MKILKLFFLLLFVSPYLYGQTQPYVLLISFDGFRWDYPNRGITPNIEKMRETGVSAMSLQPAFPSKTFPNHYSIISGQYIEHHGIIANHFNNPYTGDSYSMGDSVSVKESKWYLGEPFWTTAERQGIVSASYFWPGSEQTLSYRHPTYFERYDHYRPHETSVNGVIKWLQLPQNKRPHFITLYFHDTDDYGHDFGPNSKEISKAITSLDSVVGYVYEQLNSIGMKDSVNVIIVSDHGMTEISSERIINVETLLHGYKYDLEAGGPFYLLKPKAEQSEMIYNILKQNENHYRVYKKEEMPEYYHYSENSFIPSIILVADLGWSLVTNKVLKNIKHEYRGNHGFDNHQIDMHGILIANGPNFKKGYKTGTILNIDIYPLLCKIFNIYPASGIDGKLERVEFLLKE